MVSLCAIGILSIRITPTILSVLSKETLNLSIEKSIKQRAKEIARKKGISVSRFFEKLVTEQENPDEVFTPPRGSGAAQIANAIPEEEKVDDYDYKKLKGKMLEERFGNG